MSLGRQIGTPLAAGEFDGGGAAEVVVTTPYATIVNASDGAAYIFDGSGRGLIDSTAAIATLYGGYSICLGDFGSLGGHVDAGRCCVSRRWCCAVVELQRLRRSRVRRDHRGISHLSRPRRLARASTITIRTES